MSTRKTLLRALFCLVFAISVGIIAPAQDAATSRDVATRDVQLRLNQFAPNGIARGWEDNSEWARAIAHYSGGVDTGEIPVQKIEVESVGTGRVQMRGPAFAVQAGNLYRATIRVRSQERGKMQVWLFKPVAPYTKYLVLSVDTSDEWQTKSGFAQALESDPTARIMLIFPQTGTYFVESVSMEEGDKNQVAQWSAQTPIRAGNLVPNGEFALQNFGWATFGETPRDDSRLDATSNRYSIEPPKFTVRQQNNAAVGGLSLEEKSTSVLAGTLFRLAPGMDFKLRARVRHTRGRGSVEARLFGPLWTSGMKTQADVGQEWTTIALDGRAPGTDGLMMRTELRASGEGELEIASVSLEQKAATDAKTLPHFGVVADREMTLYAPDETPQLKLVWQGLTEKTAVKWQLLDAAKSVVQSGQWDIDALANANSQTVSLPKIPLGWYQLRWNAPFETDAARCALNLGFVPPTERKAGADSPWGIHVEGSDLGVAKMRMLGMHWLRTNNPLFTKWTAVQPQRDTWIFPDAPIKRFRDAGFDIIGNLDRTPRWAARNPDDNRVGTDYFGYKADMPANLDDWKNYVRMMATRYKGQITYWEIWNEPDIVFLKPAPNQTHAQAYAQLLETSVPIIKESDPNAKIVGGPAYFLHKRSNYEGSQENFTEQLAELGALKYLDVFGFHHYLSSNDLSSGDLSALDKNRLDWIRGQMKAAGKTPVLWNTEWGYSSFAASTFDVNLPGQSSVSPAQSAQIYVRWSVAQLASGIEKLFWYDGQDNFYYHFHTTKDFFDERQPRPIAVAAAILTYQLDAMKFSREQKVAGGREIVFSATPKNSKPNAKVAVLWADGESSWSRALATNETAMDTFGQPIAPRADRTIRVGKEPIYVVSN